MNGRVLVICASRGRPGHLEEAIGSVYETSTRADVCVYLDEDDAWRYERLGSMERGLRVLKVISESRRGHCRSLDRMVQENPGYSAYATTTDDMIYTAKGWDEWVLRVVVESPICAIAPLLTSPVGPPVYGRMDLPCLSGGWVELFGRFCMLDAEFYYWDIAIQVTAEHLGVARFAKEDEFSVHHKCLMESEDLTDAKEALKRKELAAFMDSRNTCVWMQDGRREAIRKIEGAKR